MKITYDKKEETRECVAFLRAQHEQSCFELGEHPMEYDTPYSAGADALERLSALPPQEVSVQEAALRKIAEGYGPNHLSKYARDIALRALSEGKT